MDSLNSVVSEINSSRFRRISRLSNRLRILTYELHDGIFITARAKRFHAQ